MVSPSPLYGDKGLKVDLISEKNTLKILAGVSLSKVATGTYSVETLSVEHILIHCVEYIDIRHLYFNVNTERELFDTVPPVLIISFMRRAGHWYLI